MSRLGSPRSGDPAVHRVIISANAPRRRRLQCGPQDEQQPIQTASPRLRRLPIAFVYVGVDCGPTHSLAAVFTDRRLSRTDRVNVIGDVLLEASRYGTGIQTPARRVSIWLRSLLT